MEHARVRRAQNAFSRKASDESRDIRVRKRLAVPDDSSERMAAHRFNDRVAVPPRAKARPQRDDKRRIGDFCSKIFLCQNAVHEHVGMQPVFTFRRLVRQNRNLSRVQSVLYLPRRMTAHALSVLDHRCSEPDGLREADSSPDGRGLRKIGHNDRKSDPMQPQRDARGKIPRAPNQHKHITFSFCSAPAATGQCRCSASSRASASSCSVST